VINGVLYYTAYTTPTTLAIDSLNVTSGHFARPLQSFKFVISPITTVTRIS
jgi:hypothetical protein